MTLLVPRGNADNVRTPTQAMGRNHVQTPKPCRAVKSNSSTTTADIRETPVPVGTPRGTHGRLTLWADSISLIEAGHRTYPHVSSR
jgi:hypothetical protein